MSADVHLNWFHRMRRGEAEPAPVSLLLNERITGVDLDAGTLDAEFTAPVAFSNPAGGVQGGMLGAMLDGLCAGLIDATLAPGQAPATLNLQLQFLAPARPGVLTGHAWFSKRGREICFVQGELQQDGKTVAAAQAVCKILTVPQGA